MEQNTLIIKHSGFLYSMQLFNKLYSTCSRQVFLIDWQEVFQRQSYEVLLVNQHMNLIERTYRQIFRGVIFIPASCRKFESALRLVVHAD